MSAIRDFEDAGRLSHLLWEVSARTAAVTEAALAGTPLTPASSGILDAVAANPGTSIAALARWLPTTAQGISQIVGRLERLGYLTRTLGTRGHGVALHVTPQGEQAREDANRRISDADSDLAKVLGQRRRVQLVALLQHARQALEAADTQLDQARAAAER
ncbi:MAG: MarR family transcriptional regulator [Pseudomonadota bacterium]|nr:MarR family transcriptional regulator [Pseudomonadota bacterium]